MKLRTRLAALGLMAGVALGVGASTQANASAPSTDIPVSSNTNGCVVSPLLKVGVCIPRL